METTPNPAKPRRLFKVILVLSLALNLLVVGVVVGAVWRHGGPHAQKGPGGPSWQGFAAPYVMALPKAERRALFREVRRTHPRPDRAARRAVYGEMLQALRAEPFDAAEVEDILTEQQAGVVSMQSKAKERWLGTIADMSAKDRAAYADRLQKILERGPRRHHKDKR